MDFRDLKTQYLKLKEGIDGAVARVMMRADFISGAEVLELEERLAEYVGTKHCVSCANGTDALVLALKAWDVGAGDAVFVPDFTFFASGEAPALCGATPVFVDVERDTFNISPDSLEEAVEGVARSGRLRPRAVVAVDLFGQPADFGRIRGTAEKYGMLVLEDGAQGFGGSMGERMACGLGDIGTTSFFPAKPLGCYGDGGAAFTDSDEWAERMRSLRVHGKGRDKYDNVRIGMNSRLDTIQAAILLEKLKAFEEYELDAANEAADMYSDGLRGAVSAPAVREGCRSSWAQYTVVCRDPRERRRIMEALEEAGVPSMIYYAKGMHEQVAFDGLSESPCGYENTLYLTGRALSLPMHPYLGKEDIEKITGTVLGALE